MASDATILAFLDEHFPHAHCELNYQTLDHLIVAVMLSAQTTDLAVNRVTPALFQAFPTLTDLSNASPELVAPFIRTLGLYQTKSRNLVAMAKQVMSEFQGVLPSTLDQLITLPGVGRKTASVVLVEGFKIPAFPVDTHVERVSKRLGWANPSDNATQVEMRLRRRFPPDQWGKLHHQLIFMGRYLCHARSPQCESCGLCNYRETMQGSPPKSSKKKQS